MVGVGWLLAKIADFFNPFGERVFAKFHDKGIFVRVKIGSFWL